MPSEVTNEQVERTALWCSVNIMAHDRRAIDDEAAAVLRKAAQVIKESEVGHTFTTMPPKRTCPHCNRPL